MPRAKVKIVGAENEPDEAQRVRVETTTDKNGASTTRVEADLLLGPNVPCQIVLEDGRSFYAGTTGASGEIAGTLPKFSGAFVIKSLRKGDDTIYAEGVA